MDYYFYFIYLILAFYNWLLKKCFFNFKNHYYEIYICSLKTGIIFNRKSEADTLLVT